MADYDRNRGYSNSADDNWNRDRNRYGNENDYRQTGDRYGQSNYNRDNDYNRGGYDYDRNRQYGNTGNMGNEGRHGGGYGNMGNDYNRNYGSSYNDRGGQGRNRGDMNYGSDYGTGYGTSGRYDTNWGSGQQGVYGRGYDDDYNRGYGSGYGNTWDRSYANRQDYGTMNRDYDYNRGGNWGRTDYQGQNRRGDNRDWWDKTKDEVASWFGDDEAERRRRMDERRSGENRGKGPKDYSRSEDRIREDVCDRLSDDPFVDASDIEVKIEGSDVILSGTVDSRDTKHRAEDVVESVSGVANVQNQLRVKRNDSNETENRSETRSSSWI